MDTMKLFQRRQLMELQGINNLHNDKSNSDQQELLHRSDKILTDLLKKVS